MFGPCYKLQSVKSLSVRYINELHLPLGELVEKYLKFYINVPEGVPQGFSNYFAKIDLTYSADTIATLQSGLLAPVGDSVRLLLDIEITKSITPASEQEMWLAIQSLRQPKNDIFFSCITNEWEAKLR